MTPAFTTSWDDGHPLDLRLANLLARYRFKGTFYVPTVRSEWPLMPKGDVRELDAMGMEIGSHTVNHAILPELSENDARSELSESRRTLEDLLGKRVAAFCFPKGRFNGRTCALVREAGYAIGRTTVGFRTDRDFDPSRMPVSAQLVPHRPAIHLRHALKEANVRGLLNWFGACRLESDLLCLCERMMRQASRCGGVFHLWGHSWEVEQLGLWSELEQILKMAAALGFEARTNSEVTQP
jgi:peptidoglycan/xylan/chitin deacetylase (PgdA/CDA1 family)